MTAIEFYKFITNNKIEFNWIDNEKTRKQDVLFFVPFNKIHELNELIAPGDIDDNGIHCRMVDGYFSFCANQILKEHDIELHEIFGNDINIF